MNAVQSNQQAEDQARLDTAVENAAEANIITDDTEFAPNLWSVEADMGRLEQVVLNLYMNALQAMPQEGTLKVQTAKFTV